MTALAIIKTPATFAAGVVVALFSPTDVKEIIIAVGVLIAGVGVVVVNVINARAQSRKLDAQDEKLVKQGEKLEQNLRTTEVIAGHVNSEKTAAQGKITTLEKEVALLREMMADKTAAATLLAQAAATASVHATAVPLPTQATPVLKEIAKHTSDTAANTARTEAQVQELKKE